MDVIKKQVEKHIRTSQTQKAFDTLSTALDPVSDSYKDLIVIEGSFNYLGKDLIVGIIDSYTYEFRLRDINLRLLKFCDTIPNADYINMPSEIRAIDERHIPHYIIKRAANYRKRGKYEQAREWLQIALQKQPNNIAIVNDLAITSRLLGNHKDAIFLLEHIVEKRPNDVQSLNELAICCREIERYNAALSALEKGLKLQPDNNHLHSNAFFTHLFFTLNKNEAARVWDNYAQKYNVPLIKNELPRTQFNAFLTHFDALHALDADANLIEQYIKKCLDLRANSTARFLFLNMEKQSKCLEIVKKYNRL